MFGFRNFQKLSTCIILILIIRRVVALLKCYKIRERIGRAVTIGVMVCIPRIGAM